jgi:hypothetical protein
MTSHPVYSLEQEEILFRHSLQILHPYYIHFHDKDYHLKDGDAGHSELWQAWQQSALDAPKAKVWSQSHVLLLRQHSDDPNLPGPGKAEFALRYLDSTSVLSQLKLEYIEIHDDHRKPAHCAVRPGALLLQLVIQFARLAGLPLMRVDGAGPLSFRYYRSFGFYLSTPPNPGSNDFFMDPQHACNTITGLLNTRRDLRRPDDHSKMRGLVHSTSETASLALSPQYAYELRQQQWHRSPDGSWRPTHFTLSLQLADYPDKPQGALLDGHRSKAVYGFLVMRFVEGAAWVDHVEVLQTIDASHRQDIETALCQVAANTGKDMHDGAWARARAT